MSKLEGPMFSIDARGSVCKTITYLRRAQINYCRGATFFYPKKTDIVTRTNSIWEGGVTTWQIFTSPRKKEWNDYAKAHYPTWSGFNCFMHFWMTETKKQKTPPLRPSEI